MKFERQVNETFTTWLSVVLVQTQDLLLLKPAYNRGDIIVGETGCGENKADFVRQ